MFHISVECSKWEAHISRSYHDLSYLLRSDSNHADVRRLNLSSNACYYFVSSFIFTNLIYILTFCSIITSFPFRDPVQCCRWGWGAAGCASHHSLQDLESEIRFGTFNSSFWKFEFKMHVRKVSKMVGIPMPSWDRFNSIRVSNRLSIQEATTASTCHRTLLTISNRDLHLDRCSCRDVESAEERESKETE